MPSIVESSTARSTFASRSRSTFCCGESSSVPRERARHLVERGRELSDLARRRPPAPRRRARRRRPVGRRRRSAGSARRRNGGRRRRSRRRAAPEHDADHAEASRPVLRASRPAAASRAAIAFSRARTGRSGRGCDRRAACPRRSAIFARAAAGRGRGRAVATSPRQVRAPAAIDAARLRSRRERQQPRDCAGSSRRAERQGSRNRGSRVIT